MPRTILILLALAGLLSGQENRSFPPTTLDLPPNLAAEWAKSFEKQTGIRLTIPAGAKFPPHSASFWKTLEALSASGILEIPTTGGDWKISPRKGPATPISVDGAFRFELREIRSVKQFRENYQFTEIQLQLAWEPRYPVCRVDSQPRITQMQDDLGNKYAVEESRRRTSARGNFVNLAVRISGIPRKASELSIIAGSLFVTASPKWESWQIEDLSKPSKRTASDHEVTFASFRKDGKYWTAEIANRYLAKDFADFESFERERTAFHIATLISPEGKRFSPSGFEDADNRFFYRFEEDAKTGLKISKLEGWSLEYRYPSTWTEVPVKFKFEKVPLP